MSCQWSRRCRGGYKRPSVLDAFRCLVELDDGRECHGAPSMGLGGTAFGLSKRQMLLWASGFLWSMSIASCSLSLLSRKDCLSEKDV